MARLYTNENFPVPSVTALRSLGHDVLTSHDAAQSNRALGDADVLSFAVAQERAVVTLNRRHFVRLHDRHPDHAGIVICTFDADFEALAGRVHDAVTRLATLAGRLVRVNRPPEDTRQSDEWTVGMSTAVTPEPRIARIAVTDDEITAHLTDGRSISTELDTYRDQS